MVEKEPGMQQWFDTSHGRGVPECREAALASPIPRRELVTPSEGEVDDEGRRSQKE